MANEAAAYSRSRRRKLPRSPYRRASADHGTAMRRWTHAKQKVRGRNPFLFENPRMLSTNSYIFYQLNVERG